MTLIYTLLEDDCLREYFKFSQNFLSKARLNRFLLQECISVGMHTASLPYGGSLSGGFSVQGVLCPGGVFSVRVGSLLKLYETFFRTTVACLLFAVVDRGFPRRHGEGRADGDPRRGSANLLSVKMYATSV